MEGGLGQSPRKGAVSPSPLHQSSNELRQAAYHFSVHFCIRLMAIHHASSPAIAIPTPDEILAAIQQGRSLVKTNLRGVQLNQTHLAGVDLGQVNLIGANLRGANLSRVNLRGADLRGANLQDTNLTGADLRDTYLFRAQVQGCDFLGADLTEARLKLAVYNSQTTWPEGFDYRNSGAIGPQANLSGAFLNTANLKAADLYEINLRGAYLSGADLTGANLTGAYLSGASLKGTFLAGACLRGARLNGAELQGADLRAADLTDANLEQLQGIAGADFTLAQGLTDEVKAMLCCHPSKDLGTWNTFTRSNTAQSLGFSAF